MQGEIRQDKITKQWVIYAPSRGKRPSDFQQQPAQEENLPPYDAACPFCAGNDHLLATITMELPGPAPAGWQTRVVPNKYPVLTPDGDMTRYRQGIYVAMDGYGRHEVVIDSPDHNRDIPMMSPEEVRAIVETYHRRYRDLMSLHRNMMIVIFRNHGAHAGTSLVHPHSQIVVTGMVPNYIRWREEEAQRYFDEWGRCVFQDVVEFEMQDRRRVVAENGSFVAFVPFAASVPFEVWIVPVAHQTDFGDISEEHKSDFADLLHLVLCRLHEKLGNPDYNYIINTPARYKTDEPHLRWYLQIRPRLTTRAGFEIGSGISVNPSLPEHDADFLNGREPS